MCAWRLLRNHKELSLLNRMPVAGPYAKGRRRKRGAEDDFFLPGRGESARYADTPLNGLTSIDGAGAGTKGAR